MRRSLTLIEIIVASVILAMVSLVSMTLMAVLQRSNAVVAKNVDVARDARRVVGDIARDLRQTGFAYDETFQTNYEYAPIVAADASAVTRPGFGFSILGDTAAGALPVLAFRKRTGFQDDLDADWNEFIEYEVVTDGTFTGVQGNPTRYALQRRIGIDVDNDGLIGAGDTDQTYVIARDISRVVFSRPDQGDATTREDDLNIDIRIEFTRPDTLGSISEGIAVEYRERIRMCNLPEERD